MNNIQLPIPALIMAWRLEDIKEERSALDAVKEAALPFSPDDLTESDLTASDVYSAQTNWNAIGLARIEDVTRRVAVCKTLLRALKKKAPALQDSDAFRYWTRVIDSPDIVFAYGEDPESD